MNAYQVYRQTQAQTAAPGELVVMLYQGAVRFVGAGIEAIENKNVQSAHDNLVKAQTIITELSQSLDLERGGDIAANLSSIYDYLYRQLIEANMRKDPKPARQVHGLLRELLPAWQEVARQTRGAAPTRPLAGAAR
jgi:flagellar secretion chaperone FliS